MSPKPLWKYSANTVALRPNSVTRVADVGDARDARSAAAQDGRHHLERSRSRRRARRSRRRPPPSRRGRGRGGRWSDGRRSWCGQCSAAELASAVTGPPCTRRPGRQDELQVGAVGEQALDVEHVDAGLLFGVGGAGRERVEQVHRPEDQPAAPGQRLAADADHRDPGSCRRPPAGRSLAWPTTSPRLTKVSVRLNQVAGGAGNRSASARAECDRRTVLDRRHAMDLQAPRPPDRLPGQPQIGQRVVRCPARRARPRCCRRSRTSPASDSSSRPCRLLSACARAPPVKRKDAIAAASAAARRARGRSVAPSPLA